MEDRVRVIRIIEYIGTRKRVEDTLSRSLHGTHDFGELVVRTCVIGEYPNPLLEKEESD